MPSKTYPLNLADGGGFHSLTNSEFHVTNPYAPVQPTMWESAAALQEAGGTEFTLPHRDGSPATTNADPIPGQESIDVMTKDMRALVKKIQDLRHLGIEDNKIALPKICVVGDQSTGKSSLIEGMSEINVPRSAGTCTRCPMEINLSDSNEPWKCEVKLSYSYAYSTKGGLRKITKTNKLGPWYETDEPQDVPFLTLHSKDQVQNAIKRAQLAILNPHKNPAEFLSSSLNIDDATTTVKFSPNVVRLDISAPGFPNLAFYDLPGVISQAEVDEEAYLVTLVENLVKHYVAQENCIILLTLPMTDDATNSSAARIVREIKATGRTLGVLTKPDRVEDIAQWADLLNGDKFHLGHGYYVVRNNPNPSVEHRQARIEEAQFFSTDPWISVSLSRFRPRLGTHNLQNALSALLIEQIKTSLPNVKKRIREKALRIHDELRELREPVNQNSFYVLCTKLQELKSGIAACLEGGSKDMPVLKLWNRIAQDFASAIQRTRPDLRLLTDQEDFKVDDESDCEIIETKDVKQTPKRKLSPQEDVDAASTKTPSGDYTEHFQDFTRPERTFELEEIRSINEDCSSGPTAHLHPKAVERVHGFSVSHWELPMRTFVDVTFKQVKKAVMAQIKSVLVAHQETELYRRVCEISYEFLKKMKENVHLEAGKLYILESTEFIANDRDALQKWGGAYYSEFKKARKEKKAIALYRSRGIQLPSDRAKYEKAIEALNFGCDQFTNELKLMAAAHAHYKVASCRFVDHICMIIHSKLFSECKARLLTEIEKGLGIHEADASHRCLQLMADDPERLERREFLLKEKEKLELALEWLASAVKYSDPSDEDVEMSNGQENYIESTDDN